METGYIEIENKCIPFSIIENKVLIKGNITNVNISKFRDFIAIGKELGLNIKEI